MRLVSSLSVALVAASMSAALAQPAGGGAPAPPVGAGSGSDTSKEVDMSDDPPPNDIDGTNETPEDPNGSDKKPLVTEPAKKPVAGFPIEEAARPITLPRGMSEVAIDLRNTFDPFDTNATLRARYGITREWQIGLRYNIGGVFEDITSKKTVFNLGKAAGLNLTYLFTNWIGASVDLPFYLAPVATSLNIGAPIRFRFGDKVTIGGLNDLLEIRLAKFVPSYTFESLNELRQRDINTGTLTDTGYLNLSGYGIYQYQPNLAIIGRLGVTATEFSSIKLDYNLRAGVQYSPKKFLDLGVSAGFRDADTPGTFGLEATLQFRI